ncbi:DUF6415 family natural product biosynthesis protein [Streptomyces chrestomyceticus]|uniref:DUF6415 family natural product biosynthesis protein n=1 Tax=Streptomyces chrestomyceticus TaxID=68185 RepID=A0ABU7X6T9_9ACTN
MIPSYDGIMARALPLDRGPYLALVTVVLTWSAPGPGLQPRDYEQIAVQLADHAGALADDVRRRCAALPAGSKARDLTETVLGEAGRRLSARPQPTMASAQHLARLVRALYERLDRLKAAAPAAP